MATHPLRALAESGVAALKRGDAASARAVFEQVTRSGAATPQIWLLLAQSCQRLGDGGGEERALDAALQADRRNLVALIRKGDLALAKGDDRGAVSFYQLALNNAPETASPELAARLAQAEAAVGAASARFRAHLEGMLAGGTAPGPRFREALAILSGAQPVYLQQPTSFYYPRLPNIAFYDPAGFDWIGAFTAAVPAMRAELEAVLAADSGLTPYVQGDPGRPNRGHALLDDPRWSAFHLWRSGAPVPDAAARCPATMAALDAAPIPRIAGRSPMALFSVLRPGTHIPPHHGMLNSRLICHIPLIVPDGCRLRVGGETRAVQAGVPMIFDDSIEHEAWNDSRETRVVLLFEIWRPELDAAECAALTTLFEAIGTYDA